LERLRQFAISSNVTSGGGLRKAFGGGSVFSIPETKRQRPSFGGVSTHPFQLSDASVGTTLKVKIKFGMVNSLTPGGMGDVAEPDLILTVTATKYVVLTVTTDSGGIATSAAISLETTVAADTATSAKQALGLITYTTGTGGAADSIAFSQVVAGSLRHQRCGSTQHLFGSVWAGLYS
jgi:hypothetical protein